MGRSDLQYMVLESREYARPPVTLRAVSDDDIELIRQWRNQQMEVLRQSSEISKASQDRYFREEVWPQMESPTPTQVLLAIDRNRELVGYGGLVNIDWSNCKAEISFLLAPELEKSDSQKSDIFSSFLGVMREVAFEEMNLNRLFTETYSFRSQHISILESNSFREEGLLRQNVILSGSPIDSVVHALLRSDIEMGL